MPDNRDYIEREIDGCRDALIAILISFGAAIIVGKWHEQQAKEAAKSRRLVLPAYLEHEGRVHIPSGKPVRTEWIAAGAISIMTLFFCSQATASGVVVNSGMGIAALLGFFAALYWFVHAAIRTTQMAKDTADLTPPQPFQLDRVQMYTVALPPTTEWDGERAYRFMEQLLLKVNGQLTFQIVAKRGYISWRILDLRSGSEQSVIIQAIRASYPDADVQVGTLRFEEVEDSFYRSSIYFRQEALFFQPIKTSLDLKTFDPLQDFAQGMEGLRENERIVYTLYVAGKAPFAIEQGARMLEVAVPTNPLRYFTPAGAAEAGYAAVAGEQRENLYERRDHDIFCKKVYSPLYHAILMLQVEAPTRERVQALSSCWAHVAQFSDETYNHLVAHEELSNTIQTINDTQTERNTSAVGQIARWLSSHNLDWQRISLILNPQELAASGICRPGTSPQMEFTGHAGSGYPHPLKYVGRREASTLATTSMAGNLNPSTSTIKTAGHTWRSSGEPGRGRPTCCTPSSPRISPMARGYV